MKNLLKRWSNYKKDPRGQVVLKHQYSTSEELTKREIVPALVFWRFVRKEVSSEIRRDFCHQFLEDENYFIRIIARVEILPDKVWRKILWVENVDFIDYEATLRRINMAQTDEISEAFDSLEAKNPTVPKVFKKNFFDFILVLLGFITARKLLSGPYGEKTRWYSKGAWAFNLLSLDFGFSMYPQGKSNDTKITNKSFSRFLSIKEHINDFIVNKEDGLYWKLYRSARSNFVWFPNKNVQLSTHVCPGFWKTLLLHLWFWIVSPVGFTLTVILGHSAINIGNISLILLFSITPLWILIASLKVIGKLLYKFLILIAPPFKNFILKIGEKFEKLGKFLSYVSGTKIFKTISDICKAFAIIIIFIVILVAFIYVCTLIWPLLIKLFWFLVRITGSLISSIKKYPFSYILGVFSLIAIIFSLFILRVTELDDEEYAKYDKVVRFVSNVWFIGLISLVFFVLKEGVFDLGLNSLIILIPVTLAFCLIIVLSFETYQINMETLEKRLDSKSKAYYLYGSMFWSHKNSVSKTQKIILKNDWVMKIDQDSYMKLMTRLSRVIEKNYHFSDKNRDRFLRIILPVFNQDLLEKLEKPIPEFIVDPFDKFTFLYWLRDGFSIKEATRKTKRSILTETKKKEVKSKLYGQIKSVLTALYEWIKKWIFRPIVYLFYGLLSAIYFFGEGLSKILNWLRRFFLTLKDVWSLFNERCPYISKSEYLE